MYSRTYLHNPVHNPSIAKCTQQLDKKNVDQVKRDISKIMLCTHGNMKIFGLNIHLYNSIIHNRSNVKIQG